MKERLNIKLVYQQEELGVEWQNLFGAYEDVEIVQADITTLSCDAVVSPANSFGFMDGGLDYYLSERFGWQLQDELQSLIRALPERELLVGRSITLATGDAAVPYLISAPTMRVPMSYNIPVSVNAYLAMKAILIAADAHPDIYSVAIPGLCTGCGRMPASIAAMQMFEAYKEIMHDTFVYPAEFGAAQHQQLKLNPKSFIWDF